MTDFAFALDLGAAEIGKPGAAKFGDPLQRLAPRLEHRMDEMHAAAFVGEDVSDKQPLIDLRPSLALCSISARSASICSRVGSSAG